MIKIKKFTTTNIEFKELARIENLVHHDSISNADENKNDWNNRDKNLIIDRLILYNNDIIIGVLYYSQGRGKNSRTAFYTLSLDPTYNNNGYRNVLYNKMLKVVKVFNCNLLHTSIYDHPNYSEHKKLLIKHSFKLVQTNREYSCDITKIDLEKYKPLIKKIENDGIKFYDSKEEMATNDKEFPNHFKQLEELEWKIEQDIPIPGGISHTRLPFKRWLKLCHDFYKNSYGADIVALYKEKYIACTDIFVFHKSEPHKGWTGSLGVLREFRRKGVATALKIKTIEILLKKGVTEIRTDNEENNPMYKINIALGFKPTPFSLDYSKKI